MIDERRLIQAIDSHTEEIATLNCLVIGLLKHIRQTQGEDSAQEAISFALEEASRPQPMGRVGPSTQRIRDFSQYI